MPHICQRSIQVTLRSPYGHFSLRKAADLPRKAGCVDCDDIDIKNFNTFEWLILHDFRRPVIPLYIFCHGHHVVSRRLHRSHMNRCCWDIPASHKIPVERLHGVPGGYVEIHLVGATRSEIIQGPLFQSIDHIEVPS